MVGFTNLFSRSTSTYSASENSAVSLLIDECVQALAYFLVAIVAVEYKKIKCGLGILIGCCICILISYPPTGISRYETAAIYLGLLITFSGVLKKSNLFVFIFMGGFSIILPLLNAFKYVAFEQVNLLAGWENMVGSFSTMWLAEDYDAYTMFTLVIDSVSKHGMTWMRQFLGVVLFWVPRALWNSKPVGSGYYVAEQLGWTFKNLSCPLPGEAYINLGRVGILIFAYLLGKIMHFLDLCYWDAPREKNRIIDILYPVTLIMFFFMCRGDLLSSTAYMVAYIVVGYILTLTLSCANPSK